MDSFNLLTLHTWFDSCFFNYICIVIILQVHLSNLNTALKSFDSCPSTESSKQQAVSALVETTLCSSYGLFENLQFYPSSAKSHFKSKICGFTDKEKIDFMTIIKSGFSVNKFIMQVSGLGLGFVV